MRRRRQQRKWALAAMGAALLLVGGMAALIAPWSAGQYDAKTFCPKTGQYARTAVLMDATDSLGAAQTRAVADEMNELRGRLELYEWVGVFVLNEDNLILPRPETALCNPGSEETCNPLFINCKDARLRFDAEFAAPMERTVKELAKLPPGAASPILEMIRAAALDRNFAPAQKRRLIIISDMLQNVPAYSHYQNGADFAAWAKTDYAREFLQLPLAGVEVEIWYVKRAEWKHLQTRRHVEFWEKFFAATGASVRRLQPL